MPNTTDYVHYEHSGVCNIVASGSNICAVDNCTCVVPTGNDVTVWNLRTGAKLRVFPGSEHLPVTQVCLSPTNRHVAIGAKDGTLRVYDRTNIDNDDQPMMIFDGHKTGIGAATYSGDEMMLATGGQDCAIILWDLVTESGLFRLLGHKAAITQLKFVRNNRFLISSSKDTFVKFWCISSQSCFFTLADHKTEIFDFLTYHNYHRLMCGSAELELRVYKLEWKDTQEGEGSSLGAQDGDEMNTTDTREMQQANPFLTCTLAGVLLRSTRGRTHQLAISTDQTVIVAVGSVESKLIIINFSRHSDAPNSLHGANQYFDVLRVYNEQQSEKRRAKKLKLAKKQSATGELSSELEAAIVADFTCEIVRVATHKCSDKVKAVTFAPTTNVGEYRLFVSLGNNNIDCVNLSTMKSGEFTFDTLDSACGKAGHRTDVRTCAFSHDNYAFLTASKDSVKIWNRHSLSCVLTAPVRTAVSSTFVIGDRHCVIGTKIGSIVIYDLSSGEMCEELTDAHNGAVWALCRNVDSTKCISASADKTLKLWDFELKTDGSGKRVTLTQRRVLELPDECLAAAWRDKYVVTALLNNNAMVYFADTFKTFLTLHGHSLPVLCVDVSHDEKLVVTGSADKTIKVWGLDFGDCRKSMFAHDDSVTCIKFMPKSTLFFSASKDGRIKQWDSSNFEQIQMLKKHTGEIWCLALTSDGRHLLSASHDRTVRLWQRTEDMLVLEEQKEIEREEEAEKYLLEDQDVIPGESNTDEIGLASKRTLSNVKSVEDVIEALEIGRNERLMLNEPNRTPHPLLRALKVKNLDHFVLDAFKKIRPSVFYHQLVNNVDAQKAIDQLRTVMQSRVEDCRDVVGFNLAALRLLQWELEERTDVQLFMEANDIVKKKQKKKKRNVEHTLAMSMT